MSDWPIQLGWLLAGVSVGGVVILASRYLWRRIGHRAATLDGIKIEVHGVHPVEDLFVEDLWQATLSMTNRSRKPRPLPVLASRATITAGKKRYLATVFLERDAAELSPDDVAIVWVEATLSAGAIPRSLELVELRSGGAPRPLSLRTVPRTRDGRTAPVTA